MRSTVETATGTRPFHIDIPEEKLTDLRRRTAATQWPEKETVADQSQGVPLANLQKLARHWETKYDWREFEAKLNALPQFMTEIDGLDISPRRSVLPSDPCADFAGMAIAFHESILWLAFAYGGRTSTAMES